MKTIHSAIPLLLLLVLAPCALCQRHDTNHEPFGEACPSLYSAAPATLLKYLNDNRPTKENRSAWPGPSTASKITIICPAFRH